MAEIKSSIKLTDNFTAAFDRVIDSVYSGIAAMENMRAAAAAPVSAGSFDAMRGAADAAAAAVENMRAAVAGIEAPNVEVIIPDPPESVTVPVAAEIPDMSVDVPEPVTVPVAADVPDVLIDAPEPVRVPVSAEVPNINVPTPEPVTVPVDVPVGEFEQINSELSEAVRQQEELSAAAQNMGIEEANAAYAGLSETIDKTDRHIGDNEKQQEGFNESVGKGTQSAEKLNSVISKIAGTLAAAVSVNKIFGFVEDCTEAFNVQNDAETQLMSTLANSLDADYISGFEIAVSADTSAAADEISSIGNDTGEIELSVAAKTAALNSAFDSITEKAAEIQGRGIYGDEAMIAAGAEFSTYFSDTGAVEMMMDTLADYAMGMTGGGEVGSQEMVNYATNLGKMMTGSYDAMTKKGFEVSEAQQAIIEGTATQEQITAALGAEYVNMSSDMQAAAAISQVIEESWSGIYENMSNTPAGKIQQLTNAWGDMKEEIGGQLYPYVMLLIDCIQDNWDTIEMIVNGVTAALQFLIGVLSWVLDLAFSVANAFISNWSAISAVITPIGIALGIVAAALLAYKIVTGIAAVAQNVFNSSLWACPLTWVLLIIIAVIAAVIAVINIINKVTGSTISATGVICGALAAAGAFVWNLFLGIFDLVLGIINYWVNPILAFVNFFGNVFNDPIGSIIHLFGDLADNVLGVIQKIASALDFVFGSNMADTVQGWRDGLSEMVESAAKEYGNGEYEKVMDSLDLSAEDMGLSRIAYSDAWNAGYEFGESMEDLDLDSVFNTSEIAVPESLAADLAAGGMGSDVNDIAANTGDIADSMDITEEDLKYLRDIAEQETVNRFTTAEINIEQHNDISSKMDLDGIIDGLTELVDEAAFAIAEGVHV